MVIRHSVLDRKRPEMGQYFPFEIQKIDGEFHDKFVRDFKAQPNGVLEVGPEKWILPQNYGDYAATIFNFEVRPDDVFITTFPRSGTTWTQEMIWLICNDLDYETAMKVQLNKRFPFMELV
jgi:hypothetical protein